jgi:hypothetical protein
MSNPDSTADSNNYDKLIPNMYDFNTFVCSLNDKQQKEFYYTLRNMLAESVGKLLTIPLAKRDQPDAIYINGMLAILNSMTDKLTDDIKARRL